VWGGRADVNIVAFFTGGGRKSTTEDIDEREILFYGGKPKKTWEEKYKYLEEEAGPEGKLKKDLQKALKREKNRGKKNKRAPRDQRKTLLFNSVFNTSTPW